MSSHKVLMSPKFTNPYQQLLKENLESVGAEVTLCNLDWFFLFDPSVRSANVIHLHWLHVFYRKRKARAPLFAALFFIFQMFILKYVCKKRIVWTCHNLKDHENKYPLADHFCSYRMAHLADSIIVHSDIAAKRVSECYGVDSSCLKVIPHGNYIDYYERCANAHDSGAYKSQSDLVFLFFGALRPYKGVEDVVSASARIGGANHDLWIYGKSLAADVDANIMALKSGQQHIVYRSGFFDEKNIRELFSCVDVVVLPMENILTSGSMVLAMSMGKACIAPKGSYAEGVLDSNGAFFYENRCEIDGVLQEVIASKERLAEMGNYNYQRARGFDWLDIAARTCVVYSN